MKKSPSHKSRSSLGGTLIGFVIGLLVGLAAALAVAVYVTRVPVPFVDRGLTRSAEEDAKEAERNKGWNPNRAISGAPTAAPATPASGAEGAISVPPADGRNLPAAGTTSKDPLGDLVNSRLSQNNNNASGAKPVTETAKAAPATELPPGADPFTYFVQAGAFRNPDEAEAQRARLAMLGITAGIDEREQNGRTVYRVRVGPFAQKALADLTIEQLQVNRVDAALVRVQR
ncbi:MAG: SPOR domain-containing protein [Hydrogenophaga sp.]|uniref:SPOR domain-containing protein n=1 Tax=Hydrogenophaga sp. TaxID=1904254 RepID=UPI001D5BE0D3|nr:SPOR domain-containing protein [Hydrogenophaga sp.]MBX3611605.1 SPOR domain-containing protein [Hydrogenophaga sp.]